MTGATAHGRRLMILTLGGGVACAPVYSRTMVPDSSPPAASEPALAGSGGEVETSELAALLGRLIWPLAMDGVEIMSSRYGPRERPGRGRAFHRGLDLRADEGTPVHAVADGQVRRSGKSGAYGNLVVLDHRADLESLYAHLSRSLVHEGDRVRRGEVIALVGHTGNATGDHLHFELRWRGGTVDPRTVLPALRGDASR